MKLALIALTLTLQSVAGCQPPKPLLTIYGDSVTFSAREEIHSTMDDEWKVIVDAWPGRRIDQQTFAATGTVVVALGANDCLQQDQWMADVDAAVSQLVGLGDTVYWVTLPENTYLPSFPWFNQCARELNEYVRGKGIGVVDWNAVDRTGLTTDTVHLNQAGQWKYAEVIDAHS
jgi:hypothetical protein